MKRITISLPADLAERIDHEARRRRLTVSALVRESLEAQLPGARSGRREVPFAGIVDEPGLSGAGMDAVLAAEWADATDRDRG